jgi:predicted secreted protein
MSAKVISVADKLQTAYYILPGSSGDLNYEGSSADTTTFNQKYKSSESTLIGWTGSANAYIKGNAGYEARIYVASTPIAAIKLDMDWVSGNTYQVNDSTKSAWDQRVAAVVMVDNSVVPSEHIESINYLFGTVTFKSTYTVDGDVTVNVTFFPIGSVVSMREFSLTMSTEAVDTSSYFSVQDNGGFKTTIPGLKTVSVDMSGFYNNSSDFKNLVESRKPLLISFSTSDSKYSTARGIFLPISTGQSGDVGGNEDTNVTFELNVQDGIVPFNWKHNTDTVLSTAISTVFSAFLNDEKIYFKYLHDGTNGWYGTAVVTDCSLSSSIDGVNEVSISVTGSGELTPVP